MIDLVNLAEDYLKQQGAWELEKKQPIVSSQPISQGLANLRDEVSQIAGFSVILNRKTDNQSLNFAQRPDLALISQQGPATPDHVIRTKRIPQIGRDVQAYSEAYQTYFNMEAAKAKDPKTMLDAAPRVILDPELGLCTVGQTAKSAAIASDIYQHTIEIIERATQLGGYQALSATDIFEVEYWDLEQAKLEIVNLRKIAREFQNQLREELKTKATNGKNVAKKREAVYDKGEKVIVNASSYVPKIVSKSEDIRSLLLSVVTTNILFSSYSSQEHNAICDAFESFNVEAGSFVIKQGESGDLFYVVESGALDIFVKTAAGESKVGTQLGPGHSFGELALMYNTPRAATVVASVA
jgi:hypothetical protein